MDRTTGAAGFDLRSCGASSAASSTVAAFLYGITSSGFSMRPSIEAAAAEAPRIVAITTMALPFFFFLEARMRTSSTSATAPNIARSSGPE